jgi:hypothetical protein
MILFVYYFFRVGGRRIGWSGKDTYLFSKFVLLGWVEGERMEGKEEHILSHNMYY